MKKVFPMREIPHLWAHRTQEDAKGGNMFFENDTIFSYGTHFPIARHVFNKSGGHCVLFTTRTYSTTTSSHISMVRQAIPEDVPVFYARKPDQYLNPSSCLPEYRDKINALWEKAKKSRANGDNVIAEITATISEANKFAEFFGFKTKFKSFPSREVDEILARAKRCRDTKREREPISLLVRVENAINKKKEAIKRWCDGENVSIPDAQKRIPFLSWKDSAAIAESVNDAIPNTTYLRRVGNNVQTSFGARVPVEHARLAYKAVLGVMESGKPYRHNGHTLHVGNYQIDSIDVDGTLIAGCHTILFSEINRFATLMQWK